MDSYHHHQNYIRPPQPPPSSDPHHYLHHQPRPPLPPQPTWYPNHFQYNPPQPQPPSSHSPSPPPPQQWPPPPHPHPAYPPPPAPNPYPSFHPQPGPQFPLLPPRPHLPGPPQGNQEWANPNWGQHQGWDYQGAQNNTEDWATRARAWAAQNASTVDQNHQPQLAQASKTEEQYRYHDQYQQSADSHYQQPYQGSGYQQFPVPAVHSQQQQQPIVHQQENASFSAGQPSNDSRVPYTVGAGSSVGAPTTSSSALQQEVPSSYSSVAGNGEATVQMDQPYKSLPLPISSTQEGQHHIQQPLSAPGGSVLPEQPFLYSNQGADLTVDPSNQPLQFASNFSHDHDSHMQTNYGSHHDSAGSARGYGPVPPLPAMNSWTPTVGTGAGYPPIPPGLPMGHQHDPSLAVPSISGHAAPPFGSFPGTSFPPTIPAAGPQFGIGSGTVLPSTGFPSDAYGINFASERPKKASVPNWLKEEIIKNASVITRSALEHPKEESQSIEDESVEKSSGKVDQADSKSIDSSRSTEEDDEDQDEVEAVRTVAINQEIKRILTEVLLKVTDELFDEIATKVLQEDDLTDEVDHDTSTSNAKISPSPPEVPTPKASAKVLVPVRTRKPDNEDTSEKSSSSAPGNVLGLANYASDDDGDDDGEIKSSTMSNVKENDVQQSNNAKVSEHLYDENGDSAVDIGKNIEGQVLETERIKASHESRRQVSESGTRDVGTTLVEKKTSHTSNGSSSKATFDDNSSENSQVRNTRTNLNENQQDQKRNYSGKEKDIKEADRRGRPDEKGDGNHRRKDEKHPRKEKTDVRNSSEEQTRVRSGRTGERAKESDSRKKSSHLDVKEERKESGRHHRSSAKEDDDRKRSRGKDKEEDRARHKRASDSSKHKRRRSSSTSSRDRNSKDSNSSDEASEGSKRRLHSRKRDLSPSPVRSKRRQVSRSPHSKHSQRRHSPYSSLETSRVRRSRSRSKSPVRRRR